MALSISTRPALERALAQHPEGIRGRFINYKLQYFVGATKVEHSLIHDLNRLGAVITKWDGTTPVMHLKPATEVQPAARHSHPATSHQAARVVAGRVKASHAFVLTLIDTYGAMTHSEMIENAATMNGEFDYSDSRIRSATAELVRLGQVEAKGRTATGHGTFTTIWGLKPR